MSLLKEALVLILLSCVLSPSIGKNKAIRDSSVPAKEKQKPTENKPGPPKLQNAPIKGSSLPSKDQHNAKGGKQVSAPGVPKPAVDVNEKKKLTKDSSVPSKDKQKATGSSQDASKGKDGHSRASKPAIELNEKGLPKSLDTSQASVQKLIVNLHNDIRRKVDPAATNMKKMEWNKEAAVNALKWAEHCEFAHSNSSMRAIKTSGCGENVFMASFPSNWTLPIIAWYSEIKSFTYGDLKVPWYTIGHYTQMVWSSTYQLGCAAASCKTFFFTVCQYCPPGNYIGQIERPYQVGKQCANCPNNCDNGLCTKL